MATYDLEEQEQISELKAWWQQYGRLLLAVAIAALAAVTAYNLWKRYQWSQAAEASAIFAALQSAAAVGDVQKARDAGGDLISRYGGTHYAAMGALVSAKALYESGDSASAKARLQWAMDEVKDPELRDIARLRLAGVLFDEKAYDEALKLLAEAPVASLAPRYAELRGDVLAATGKTADARQAYQEALAKMDAAEKEAGRSQGAGSLREVLQAKLDATGAS